jgi:hypothetical protein
MELDGDAGGPFCGVRENALLGENNGIGSERGGFRSDGIVHFGGIGDPEALDRDRAEFDERLGGNCFQNLDFVGVGGIVESLGGFGDIHDGASGEEREEGGDGESRVC